MRGFSAATEGHTSSTVSYTHLDVYKRQVAGSLARRIGYPDGTRLKNTVVEYCLKDPELADPLVNLTHITAMGLATPEEMGRMEEMLSLIHICRAESAGETCPFGKDRRRRAFSTR